MLLDVDRVVLVEDPGDVVVMLGGYLDGDDRGAALYAAAVGLAVGLVLAAEQARPETLVVRGSGRGVTRRRTGLGMLADRVGGYVSGLKGANSRLRMGRGLVDGHDCLLVHEKDP